MVQATSEEFTIFDNPNIGDPYPMFAMLRANAPVAKMGTAGLWAVSRYDDVLRVLRDPETFSSEVSAEVLRGEPARRSMIFNDPPVHTRLRGLISKAFTPRMIELQRAAVEENCARFVDAMCAQEDADVIAGLAYPLPVMVIANMLGVGDGDMATFKRWSDAIIENVGVSLMMGDDGSLDALNAEFDAYFKARLDKLRREPEDNLLSGLVHAETEEGRLSEEDLLIICRLLLVAGNETTTGLIVNSIRVFAEFPDVLTQLRERPELVPSGIEEILRYYAPFAATFRRATRDVEIGGVTIPKNDRVLPLMASANRDERQFERPDEFIIDRDPNRHLSFGMGIHYCLGAPLARMEGEIAVRALLSRITGVRITSEVEPGVFLRPGGPEEMWVRWDLASDRSVGQPAGTRRSHSEGRRSAGPLTSINYSRVNYGYAPGASARSQSTDCRERSAGSADAGRKLSTGTVTPASTYAWIFRRHVSALPWISSSSIVSSRDRCRRGLAVAGGPRLPHRPQEFTASEPLVELRVHGHRQIGRDGAPSEEVDDLAVLRHADEDPADDVHLRGILARLLGALPRGRDRLRHVLSPQPVDDRAVGLRAGEHQHLLAQRRDVQLRRRRERPARQPHSVDAEGLELLAHLLAGERALQQRGHVAHPAIGLAERHAVPALDDHRRPGPDAQ